MEKYILIVDNDVSAAQVTCAGVKRTVPEAIVVIEHDAERAFSSLARQRPDVLIIDPPRHSAAAVRLIRELKQGSQYAHVIVLASAPSPTLQREMQRLGVDVYLKKPSPLAPILAAIRAIFAVAPAFSNA